MLLTTLPIPSLPSGLILHLAVLHLVVLKSQAQLVCKAFKLVLALHLLMSHGRGKLHAISDSKDRK